MTALDLDLVPLGAPVEIGDPPPRAAPRRRRTHLDGLEPWVRVSIAALQWAPPPPARRVAALELGEAIRAHRTARGWSQGELAGRLGLAARTGPKAVSRWENGRGRPDRRHLAALIALGVELPPRAAPSTPAPLAEIARREREGRAVCAWRRSTGRTLMQLAALTRTQASVLSRVENGRQALGQWLRDRLVALGYEPASRGPP